MSNRWFNNLLYINIKRQIFSKVLQSKVGCRAANWNRTVHQAVVPILFQHQQWLSTPCRNHGNANTHGHHCCRPADSQWWIVRCQSSNWGPRSVEVGNLRLLSVSEPNPELVRCAPPVRAHVNKLYAVSTRVLCACVLYECISCLSEISILSICDCFTCLWPSAEVICSIITQRCTRSTQIRFPPMVYYRMVLTFYLFIILPKLDKL